jgi:hypothetical protein
MTWRDGRQMYRLIHNPGSGLGVMGNVPLRIAGRGAERTEDIIKTGVVFVKVRGGLHASAYPHAPLDTLVCRRPRMPTGPCAAWRDACCSRWPSRTMS